MDDEARRIENGVSETELAQHLSFSGGSRYDSIVSAQRNVLHKKQLSADSALPRLKYNFNSTPKLRPKDTSTVNSNSSPGTPNLSLNRRRKPPPPPNVTPDPECNTSTVMRHFCSSPVILQSEISSNSLARCSDIPLNIALSKSPLSSSNITTPKARRRTPPPPPISLNSNPRQSNVIIGTSPIKTYEGKDDTDSLLENERREQLPWSPKRDAQYDGAKLDNADEKKTLALLFTPPSSRSTALKRSKYNSSIVQRPVVTAIDAGMQNRHSTFSKHDAQKMKSSTLAPALSKPLPALPSAVSKPLPPIPISQHETMQSSSDSDYAFIPDYPINYSSTVNGLDLAKDDGQYISMFPQPNQFGEYVSISKNGRQCPSQSGYEEDEYMKMSSNVKYVNASTVKSSDTSGEEVDYIPMMPSQHTNSQSNSSRGASLVVTCEDDYIPMSSVDGDTKCLKSRSSSQVGADSESHFDFNSMYIDLDMLNFNPSLSQHESEAKHPKTRFSISSSGRSPERKSVKKTFSPPSTSKKKSESSSEESLKNTDGTIGVYATISTV